MGRDMGDRVMSVFLAVNDKPVPIEDCSWYYYAPCGCCIGATLAVVDGFKPLVTEDDAWRDFFARADQRRAKKAKGYRFQTGLTAEAGELLREACTHRGKRRRRKVSPEEQERRDIAREVMEDRTRDAAGLE